MILFIADVTLSALRKKIPAMPHTVSQIIKYRKKVLLIDQRNHKGCLNVGEPQRLHQALSSCSNNKAPLYPIKKEPVLVNQSYHS